MTQKHEFKQRILLAKTAYQQLKHQRPELPERIPPLFEAGFTLGMVTQEAIIERRKRERR